MQRISHIAAKEPDSFFHRIILHRLEYMILAALIIHYGFPSESGKNWGHYVASINIFKILEWKCFHFKMVMWMKFKIRK